MKLTETLKNTIDSKSIADLLAGVRFTKIGDPMFQGESGEYWVKRLQYLRDQPGGALKHVQASKYLGW